MPSPLYAYEENADRKLFVVDFRGQARVVDGTRALHAVFTGQQGERLSLFEVPLPVELDELKAPRLHELAGASVTVSARDGLLVVLAHSTI